MSDLVTLVKKTGGSTIGEHEWAKDGSSCDVTQELASELISIDPEEFSVAEAKPAAKRAASKSTE